MQYCVLKQEADPAKFVKFWSKRYDDRSEQTYREHIERPLTPESTRKLFSWKAMQINRRSIEKRQNPFVETVVGSLDRFRALPCESPKDADDFLTNELKGKGMIWKIFTLHIMHPELYPIFDQNVYRAMHYLQTGTIKEIPGKNDNKKICYLNEYLPFYNSHGHYEDRKLDKALFSFGQFLKIPRGRAEETRSC